MFIAGGREELRGSRLVPIKWLVHIITERMKDIYHATVRCPKRKGVVPPRIITTWALTAMRAIVISIVQRIVTGSGGHVTWTICAPDARSSWKVENHRYIAWPTVRDTMQFEPKKEEIWCWRERTVSFASTTKLFSTISGGFLVKRTFFLEDHEKCLIFNVIC